MPSGRERKFAYSYLERGKRFMESKQYAEAIEALQEATRGDPSLIEAWINLAIAHFYLNEFTESLGAADEALKYDLANGAAWNVRGGALVHLERDQEALDSFMQAMQDNRWFLTAARNAFSRLYDDQRYDEAAQIAETTIERYPGKGSSWAMRSLALLGQKRYEEALAAAQRAVQIAPHYDYSLCALTEVLRKLRRFDEALDASQRGVNLFPDSPIAWNEYGKALMVAGRLAEAIAAFGRASTLSPGDDGCLCCSSDALISLRRFEQAITLADRALALRSRSWAAAINRAEALNCLERYEDAAAQLAIASEFAAHHPEYWAVKGLLHTCRGEHDEALTAVKKALEMDRDDVSGWEGMAEVLVSLEDWQKAIAVTDHGLEMRPHRWRLRELKAKALRGLGRVAEADEIDRAWQTQLAEQQALLDAAEGSGG